MSVNVKNMMIHVTGKSSNKSLIEDEMTHHQQPCYEAMKEDIIIQCKHMIKKCLEEQRER